MVEEVGACGGEYGSARCLLSVQIAEFWSSCCGPLTLRPSSRYLHANTSHTFSKVSPLDSDVETWTPHMLHVFRVGMAPN